MSDNMNSRPAWMEDDLVQNIPPEKLDFLNRMFHEANARKEAAGSVKSQKEMLMLLMPVLKEAKAANLTFTPAELQSAIAAIRKYSSPDELKQIDNIYKQHLKS